MHVCVEKDVSLLAYSPMAGGTLSGKYIENKHAKNSRLNLFPGYMERYNKSAARAATVEYMKARTLHLAPPATAHCLQQELRLPERHHTSRHRTSVHVCRQICVAIVIQPCIKARASAHHL
jgi:hypothetical protein